MKKVVHLRLMPAATLGPTPFPNGCFDVSKISLHTTEFLVTCVCEILSQFVCDVCHVLQEIEEVGKFTVEFQNNLTHFETTVHDVSLIFVFVVAFELCIC